MIKNPTVLLRDIRNVRRNQTVNLHNFSAKDLSTSKEITKVRSTKQIDLTAFMENKNEKIKHIDQKLEIHQTEIAKNNTIIEELTNNFLNLKVILEKEKEALKAEENKSKQLKEDVEKANKTIKIKNLKLEEMNRKNIEFQKQLQIAKSLHAKIDEYGKSIAQLRQRNTSLEEMVCELKKEIQEKEKDSLKQKDRLIQADYFKSKLEEANLLLQSKDNSITTFKISLHEHLTMRQKAEDQETKLQLKNNSLAAEVQDLKKSIDKLRKTEAIQEDANNQQSSKLQQLLAELAEVSRESKKAQANNLKLRAQVKELKSKCDQLSISHEEALKDSVRKQVKIEKLLQKIKQLEAVAGESYKDREKSKGFQDKIDILKKKIGTLQHLYKVMTPQIQCPFGHELNNPVTIIPCGHNYCLGCKKGYAKECMQCNGKLKIQAVYRNELMDDIINIIGGIKTIIEILK